ncbi:MAG: hypothetical protein IPL49_10520 [Saprospirales bacterium]|nr:hypothetical protein [Saprospirales bacterium]MBK8491299.1 hypothetical protein [Saprospirales bacterium]
MHNPLTKTFLLLVTALIFSSCDPAQVIVISNHTNAPATVTFVFKEGDHGYKFSEGSDTLVLNLGATDSTSTKEYFFGIGTWKIQSSFDELVDGLELIEIETNTVKETYRGDTQLRGYLQPRIGGPQQATIELKIE